MNTFLAALALAALPLDLVSLDSADAVELNHFYDGDGRLVFDQVIFWDWHADEGVYHVRAWRLWKSPAQTPWRDRAGGGYVTAWLDGERMRVVRTGSFRETWTQHDPELDDRQYFPAHERRGLTGERTTPPPAQPASAGP